jgi:hypothetical protein
VVSPCRDRCVVECGPQTPCQLDRMVVGPEMHEEHARLFGQHMAVEGRYFDAIGPQGLDYRIDFACRQYEVAGDGRPSAASWLEANSGRNAQGANWRERHPN